jgi:HAD superfamily hydrolase (TIGR01484 family)
MSRRNFPSEQQASFVLRCMTSTSDSKARRFLALATDYDGTIAHEGIVDEHTLAALKRFKDSGRKLILVTGRELTELISIFPHLDLFEWVVAENGALLYRPSDKIEKILGKLPPSDFLKEIERRGVAPINKGRVIVATWEPHEIAILETIKDLGLELQVIFNKGAVMVLPAGVNKATGLKVVLDEMGLSAHNVVGVGDAENDHAFLKMCECSVAVDNALRKIKERVDIVTKHDHGRGVVELIDEILTTDLTNREERLERHRVLLGSDELGKHSLPPFGLNVLVTGTSGAGKSTLTGGFIERLIEHSYQLCIIDPEGDYEGINGSVMLGDAKKGPGQEEILQVVKNAGSNTIVNMVGMPIQDRPAFFLALAPKLLELRAATGRPHWIIIDEAHHMLPAPWDFNTIPFPKEMKNLFYVTLLPGALPPPILHTIDVILAVGEKPDETIADFCKQVDAPVPPMRKLTRLDRGAALLWRRYREEDPFVIHLPTNRTEHRRHVRKYAEGELQPERSFYFKGPEGKLNIRAQNLMLFAQIGEGIDDETWMHHLRNGDFSAWFRDHIKDELLAEEVIPIEQDPSITPDQSRKQIRAAIEMHYTLPAPVAPKE